MCISLKLVRLSIRESDSSGFKRDIEKDNIFNLDRVKTRRQVEYNLTRVIGTAAGNILIECWIAVKIYLLHVNPDILIDHRLPVRLNHSHHQLAYLIDQWCRLTRVKGDRRHSFNIARCAPVITAEITGNDVVSWRKVEVDHPRVIGRAARLRLVNNPVPSEVLFLGVHLNILIFDD